MRYPQAFIDALKGRFTVSDVVGRYVSLRRNGREFTGLCPFHKEKTPSFTVNDEKGFYHCFGCGAHGDAIGFVKDHEGLSYKEAIEKLAHEVGLALPKMTKEEVVREKKRQSLQDVMELTTSWFEEQLRSQAGYHAQGYLDRRGLSDETISKFRVGFAPDSRDALKKHLISNGITEKQMLDCGLVIKPDDGRDSYVRFRGRIMFPIRDQHSKVIAFGGRVLPDFSPKDAPKYLNSPETQLFHKGQQLYNFDLARKAAYDKQSIIVCEGYMDVIALAQAGIDHAVAPLGTAITDSQLQILWKVADNPILCLDGDAAGERAMQRASELALPMLIPGKSLKFIKLPKGEDPDTLVRSYGANHFESLAEKALPLADVLCQHVLEKTAHTPEEKAGQEQQLMAMAEKIQDASVKAHYRTYFKDKAWPKRSFDKNGFKPRKQAGRGVPSLPQAMDRSSRLYRSVVKCTQLMLLYPKLMQESAAEEFYACMDIADPDLYRLSQSILSIITDHPEITREDLKLVLSDRGLLPIVERVMAIQGIFPKNFFHDDEMMMLVRAKRMWKQAVNAYSLAIMLEEFKEAEAEMANNMTEVNLTRFLELKSQLEHIERERVNIYQQEMIEEA